MFVADNDRKFDVDENNFVSGDILIDINDLISNDLEENIDLFAEKLVGNTLLSDVSYEVTGVSEGEIIVKITGSIEHILASRNEDEEITSFNP